jgi:phosphatidylethanolamine-binding protein (PEBP) family uncharacterized protein
MASANDVARTDDPDAQFLIIFVHWFWCNIDLADSVGFGAS